MIIVFLFPTRTDLAKDKKLKQKAISKPPASLFARQRIELTSHKGLVGGSTSGGGTAQANSGIPPVTLPASNGAADTRVLVEAPTPFRCPRSKGC